MWSDYYKQLELFDEPSPEIKTLKVAVVGGRDFKDYSLLRNTLNNLYGEVCPITVVSGGARGADNLAEKYAKCYNMNLKVFKADWETYGKSAGMIRNKEIVKYADEVVAFWNGESKGTKNTIDTAEKMGKKVTIISY